MKNISRWIAIAILAVGGTVACTEKPKSDDMPTATTTEVTATAPDSTTAVSATETSASTTETSATTATDTATPPATTSTQKQP